MLPWLFPNFKRRIEWLQASELTLFNYKGSEFQTPDEVNISMQFEITPQICLR